MTKEQVGKKLLGLIMNQYQNIFDHYSDLFPELQHETICTNLYYINQESIRDSILNFVETNEYKKDLSQFHAIMLLLFIIVQPSLDKFIEREDAKKYRIRLFKYSNMRVKSIISSKHIITFPSPEGTHKSYMKSIFSMFDGRVTRDVYYSFSKDLNRFEIFVYDCLINQTVLDKKSLEIYLNLIYDVLMKTYHDDEFSEVYEKLINVYFKLI